MLDGDVTDLVESKSISWRPDHVDIYSVGDKKVGWSYTPVSWHFSKALSLKMITKSMPKGLYATNFILIVFEKC